MNVVTSESPAAPMNSQAGLASVPNENSHTGDNSALAPNPAARQAQNQRNPRAVREARARLRRRRLVERVASMPKQGVASTFKFGASYGAVIGILAALEIRTSLVTPQTWKKHFRLASDKEKSRALALRTFAKTPEHFSRKKDHGRAEAAR